MLLFPPQKYKDIHKDLAQVGTTRNHRTIPSRSNTRNFLIAVSFRLTCIWITKQILASILENLCHALPSQQKRHYAAKQVTTQSTRISNSANKIISANNHLPPFLSSSSSWFLSLFSHSHINSPYFTLITPLSFLPLYLYGFFSA